MPNQPETLFPLLASPAELAVSGQAPVARMLETIIQSGKLNQESVGVVKELVMLYEHMQEKDAEKLFAAAFNALQSELSPVQASKSVPNNDGTVRYRFAPFEEIMEAVRPLLQKHGFTVTFSMTFSDGRVIQSCTLQHIGGHSRTNQFAARVGKGPPGSSEAQGDGAASTYAKRFALCNALNITIETDNDARADGEVISKEKANWLREQIRETGSNEAKFLEMAGVKTYEEITTAVYGVLVRAVSSKTRK